MATNSIFVSYSSKDRPFAMGLTEKLEDMGAQVWIDQRGIGLGTNWDNSIEDALETSNILLLLISSTAAKSGNVQDEVSIAKEEGKQIIPVLIEECELPMRWKRMQYADFTASPEKAMRRVLDALGLNSEEADRFMDLRKKLKKQSGESSVDQNIDGADESDKEEKLAGLLISEPEIDRAALMHKRGIRKNWMMIGFVALCSLILGAVLYIFFKDVVEQWMAITGCVLLNLLSIKPYGNIVKRSRNIELIDLLKLKRDRLIRVMNKLSDTEIEGFNSEFNNYITL
ncbi:MAG: toll/interleukin-1 receptor domain-containing protein [Flavobacteriaceae bacterium]|nr:toll/interleukin-1 receptor domain-containing protein [Bacteroidia bacterium]MBT8288538.1 toll/interleukin-1 receptor domain-containing protein [Bacteroidia bacterium]NNF74830.1 toll/interleukin-1 receptor domain-containing protein [Flavobacteriaceae bacterium]